MTAAVSPAPRVSVLMTMYNAARDLGAAVESVRAQTFTDFEFIIVDDGSTDGSVALVESCADPRIRLVRNAANQGQTACLNQGLALARGEYIARQDADDVSLPERLRRQVEFLDTHREVALLGTAGEQIDETGRVLGPVTLPRETLAIRWANLFDNSFLHSAVMFRARVVREEFGGYDEAFRCSQDYALWSQIARRHAVANLGEKLIRLRVHAGSMMRSQTSLLESETDRMLRANLAAEFPARSFSEEEVALLKQFRAHIPPAALPRFHALFAELRAAFCTAHPEARTSPALRETTGRQLARVAYNLLPEHRGAALREYARCVRAWPGALLALPWPRVLALVLLGDSARDFYRKFFPAK